MEIGKKKAALGRLFYLSVVPIPAILNSMLASSTELSCTLRTASYKPRKQIPSASHLIAVPDDGSTSHSGISHSKSAVFDGRLLAEVSGN